MLLSNACQETQLSLDGIASLVWNVFTLEVEDESEDFSNSATEDLILLEGTIEVSPFEFCVIAKEDLEDFVQ